MISRINSHRYIKIRSKNEYIASRTSYTTTGWFRLKHNESNVHVYVYVFTPRNFESYERRVTRIISAIACKSNDKTGKLLKEERSTFLHVENRM